MKKWFLNVVLKSRDRLWFYAHQQYPNDSPESCESDFRMRFTGFTMIPLIIIFGTLYFIYGRVFDIRNVNRNDLSELIPGVIVYYTTWWYFNKYVLSFLSVYPVDAKNDLDRVKNILYVLSIGMPLIFGSIGFLLLLRYIWFGRI